MNSPCRVALLFGGRSAEHQISIRSARSVYEHLDSNRYEIVPIAITPGGQWFTATHMEELLEGESLNILGARRVILPPDPTLSAFLFLEAEGQLGETLDVDVIVPILHGPMGEDGTIQGLFELANLPYVGNGVLGSATGMDKAVMKHLFSQAGIPMTPWLQVLRRDLEADIQGFVENAIEKLGLPIFVKPANMGSSVGVSSASDAPSLIEALKLAGTYDRKLILEAAVDAREIELSVLGNDAATVSVPGEILSATDVYSFESKYESDISSLAIPADLPDDTTKELQRLALLAYKAIDGAGLARMDFFVERASGRILINEVNTLPGFTSISMYPKLWGASGLSYGLLLDRLIAFAFERFEEKKRLLTHR